MDAARIPKVKNSLTILRTFSVNHYRCRRILERCLLAGFSRQLLANTANSSTLDAHKIVNRLNWDQYLAVAVIFHDTNCHCNNTMSYLDLKRMKCNDHH